MCVESQPALKVMRMYLAYLDDSGTKDKNRKFQVMTAVITNETDLMKWEMMMGFALEVLIPSDKLEAFSEFHAFELYPGRGSFDGVEESKRFHVIARLLELLEYLKSPVIYGAVDKAYLQNQLYGSAQPLDFVFRICAKGNSRWLNENHNGKQEFALLIADDMQDRGIKDGLRASFRQLRPRYKPPNLSFGELGSSVHDGIYFGDSRDSIGIQLADLCSYFIAKHIEGDMDPDAEAFYRMIEPRIVFSEVHPEPGRKS